jgi:HAD superfamily hydrolase (TIGR01509 family)
MASLTQRIQSGTIKAVLFDLDDTLFDHQYSCRSGLAALMQHYDSLSQASLDELEQLHMALLNELHMDVLRGKASIDDMRAERFRRIFLHYGEQASPAIIQEAVMLYREAYKDARRAIFGVVPLLQALHSRVHIAVVTNNMLVEQQEKLRVCGLTSLVDTLVASGEVGSIKPESAIFEITLQRIGCRAQEAIMIGDSWKADVLGAQGAGIQAVWFNRSSLPYPEPMQVRELRSFEPLEAALEILFAPSS